MTQQLKLSDGALIPITRANGDAGQSPFSDKRDYLDFTVDGSVLYDTLRAKTEESAGLTDQMTLITDDVDASGSPVHTESLMEHYTLRAACGLKTVQTAPDTGTTPAAYQEQTHLILAQRLYSEVYQAQTRADTDYIALMAGVDL